MAALDVSSREQADKLHDYMNAVYRIVVRDEKTLEMEDCGTGFLIGPNLLMTCNHVIPNLDTAQRAEAQFFKRSTVVERPTGGERNLHPHEYVKFAINPDMFFHSPANLKEGENGEKYFQEADQDHLDYTILPLQPDPSLAGHVHFSLFETYVLKSRDIRKSSTLYQHPYTPSVDVSSGVEFKGAFARGQGNIVKVASDYECHYTTPTAIGSSGGPVVNKDGKLIALHYQGVGNDDCPDKPPGHVCNAGVNMLAIKNHLGRTNLEKIKIFNEQARGNPSSEFTHGEANKPNETLLKLLSQSSIILGLLQGQSNSEKEQAPKDLLEVLGGKKLPSEKHIDILGSILIDHHTSEPLKRCTAQTLEGFVALGLEGEKNIAENALKKLESCLLDPNADDLAKQFAATSLEKIAKYKEELIAQQALNSLFSASNSETDIPAKNFAVEVLTNLFYLKSITTGFPVFVLLPDCQ